MHHWPSPSSSAASSREFIRLAHDNHGALKSKFLLRDREHEFTVGFDEVVKSEDVEVIRMPLRVRPNSYSERWLGSARPECWTLC